MATIKAKEVYTLDDPRWLDFAKRFTDRGFQLTCIFHASDEIRIWAVSDGPNHQQPQHRTFVTRHYKEGGGFGVWLESRTGRIAEGVDEVIGETVPPVPVEIVRTTSGPYFARATMIGKDGKEGFKFNAIAPGAHFPDEAAALEAVRQSNEERGTNYTHPNL